jgi:site-specific DNA recombinase
MIAAAYLRKSTDQSGVADEEKSIARQPEHARAYAIKKGWTLAEEFVYTDDGISGAEFAKRPSYLRLLNALKPRPPFQALIMSEESRLGREAIETAFALKQIITAGVRVFFYLEDRERTLDSPTDKIMLSLTTFADELEREKVQQRTADAMVRKAKAGHVTGGMAFGYDNVPIEGHGGTRSHVMRRVNDAEAATVRRIFALCAQGFGYKRIADALNADRIPSPPPRGRGRIQAWAASTVREILFRPLYRGEVVWNQRRKRDRWGQKRYERRPESEWIRQEAPELRIVSVAEWQAAHARFEGARSTYIRTQGGRIWSRGASGIESRFLLSGFLACRHCGGPMTVTSREWKSHRHFTYACSYNQEDGATILGMISERDLARGISERGTDLPALPVSKLMTTPVRQDADRESLIRFRTQPQAA